MNRLNPEFLYVMGLASVVAGILLMIMSEVWRYMR